MPKERNCWRKTIYCTICESRNRNCDIIQRYIVRYEHCDAWCLYDWESPDKISYVSRPVKHGQSHSLLSKKILAIQDSSGIIWSLWKNKSIAWSQTEVIIAVNHLEKSMLSGGCSLAPLCRPALEQPQEVLRIWKLSAQWGLRWAKLLHNWQVSCCSWWCSVCCQRSLCETLERFQSMFPTCIFHVIHSNVGLYLKSIWHWYQHISTYLNSQLHHRHSLPIDPWFFQATVRGTRNKPWWRATKMSFARSEVLAVDLMEIPSLVNIQKLWNGWP